MLRLRRSTEQGNALPGWHRHSPSPFAERGEKVAEGRMRGAAACATDANPSPQPSPLAPQRERGMIFYPSRVLPDSSGSWCHNASRPAAKTLQSGMGST